MSLNFSKIVSKLRCGTRRILWFQLYKVKWINQDLCHTTHILSIVCTLHLRSKCYCCGVTLQYATWVICRTDSPLLWHPCGQWPHYLAISDPAPAPTAAIILRQTISNISHLPPSILAIFLTQCPPLPRPGPDTWPAPAPRIFVTPRTEKYRQRKWASESRGTCRQDTSHIRPLPSADKFSPLGAGTSLEGRESRRLSLPQWILGSKTWLNNLWPYETFSPSDTETINP